MDFLLANPEHYRCGEDYPATRIVFPVEFKGERYVAKRSRLWHPLIEAYYVLQDAYFYGARKYAPFSGLRREAEKLWQLNGYSAPRLIRYNENLIIREFLEGTPFPQLLPEQQLPALEKGLEALIDIHEQGVTIGDAHIKNLLCGQKTCWLDFDGVFEEDTPFLHRAKALDLLKFVYSTYTATRDKKLTIGTAETVSHHYTTQEVRICLNQLVTPGLTARRLWFPCRIADEKLNEEIKARLRV